MTKVDTSPEAIFRNLRRIAPDIAFSIYVGDNPDPLPIVMTQEQLDRALERGHGEHDVEASALTVINGEVLEGRQGMTGFYWQPGEMDLDLHGYLPHLLLEAVRMLLRETDFPQAVEAEKFLSKVKASRQRGVS